MQDYFFYGNHGNTNEKNVVLSFVNIFMQSFAVFSNVKYEVFKVKVFCNVFLYVGCKENFFLDTCVTLLSLPKAPHVSGPVISGNCGYGGQWDRRVGWRLMQAQ